MVISSLPVSSPEFSPLLYDDVPWAKHDQGHLAGACEAPRLAPTSPTLIRSRSTRSAPMHAIIIITDRHVKEEDTTRTT